MIFLGDVSTNTKVVCGDFDNLKISLQCACVPRACYRHRRRVLEAGPAEAAHQDHGGSQREVHRMKEAHELLSDVSKRAIYDADLSIAALEVGPKW
ncbi:unnamed protein product [Urochloa humidicola]